MEQRLFFFLLRRWVRRNRWKVESLNGCYCLLHGFDFDIIIKSSTKLRVANRTSK